MYESNDGGATWVTPYSSWDQTSMYNRLHCDQHYVKRNPLVPDRIWSANDGGVYMKMDGDTLFVPRMKNLCVTQAYHFDADNFYDSTFAVGTQDNGGYFTNNGNNFYFYKGGDMYGRIYCNYYNNSAIYTWGTNFSAGTHNIDIHTGSGSSPFNVPESGTAEPISMTPATPLTAFAARVDIQETNNLNGNPAIWRVIFDNSSTAEFVAASHSLADSNLFYAVRGDGYLFRTFDALVNQPTFDSIPLPAGLGYNVSIATVPSDVNVLYACADAVFKSIDQGQTWTNITGGMNPIYGFQEIVADPFATDGSVYIAATNKIYYCNDTSGWIDYSLQLPEVSYINDITVKKFSSQVRKVMATILNRSIWASPVVQNLGTGIAENISEVPEINVYPVPAKGTLNIATASLTTKINQVIIYDEKGRQVGITRSGMNESHVKLSVEKLSAGVYILEVVTTSKSVMKKFTIMQ